MTYNVVLPDVVKLTGRDSTPFYLVNYYLTVLQRNNYLQHTILISLGTYLLI